MKKYLNNEEKCNILRKEKQNKNIPKKNIRNYGIDLIRIISMILIINHHLLFHGAPLFSVPTFSTEHQIFVFLNVICCSGVNLFRINFWMCWLSFI